MPTKAELLRGRNEDPPERIELKAGAVRMCFEADLGFLRTIRLGDQEILRGIYSAVRDHNWDTIAPDIGNVRVLEKEDGFEVTFDARHVERDIVFEWQGSITGEPDGTVSFEMDGKSNSTFRRNRIGFCVLHSPAHTAGKPCRVEKDDGSVEEGRFPDAISPHQPFKDMRAIRHEVMPGVTATVRFEGDVFEMEDQRNWTDASYKTYCTPLDRPFPVEVEAGTRISQKVTIELEGDIDAGARVPERDPVILTVDPSSTRPLPLTGLCTAGRDEPLTESQTAALQAMHLNHLRVDVCLAEATWQAVLDRGILEARAADADLEVAVHVSDAAEAELASLAEALTGAEVDVARFLVFHVAEPVADRKWVTAARDALSGIGGAIVSGTDAYFTELNRNRPPVDVLDGVCYSVNPQVHAFDDASLMETLVAQGWTVESARTFAGSLPVHVSPVTLSPRFNPNATGPEPEPEPGTLPAPVDPRQMSLLAAAWTVGSLKYLSESGASSVTYFETTGWRGVMDTEGGSPDPFPSIPGGVFPMAHVLTWFGTMRGGDLLVTRSSRHLAVDGLALREGKWVRVLAANLTAEPQDVRILFPGLEGSVRIEPMDEETVAQATTDPRGFRSRKDIQSTETSGGVIEMTLGPYAVVCVKGVADELA